MPAGSFAASIESPRVLLETVSEYLQTQFDDDKSIRYSVGKLDPRLRLAKCHTGIEAYLPVNTQLIGHSTVGLRCRDAKGWKVLVPVLVQQFKSVLVTNRNLPRGHQLSPSDVQSKKMDISSLPNGYYESRQQLSGLVLSRSLLRGQTLTPGMLNKPRWVRRGQTITIMAQSGQVAIRVKGKALMDGRQGELVRIKNTSTNRELRGIVVAEGVVKITL